MKRCLGAELEPPVVVEVLSFLDLTERERFLVEAQAWSVSASENHG